METKISSLEAFRHITEHNHRLMAEMRRDDFDGFIRLDPTLNQAVTYIHLANEAIASYPQGSFPQSIAYPMVYSTLHLLKACERRYGRTKVKAMAQAFYELFRLWFYVGEPRHPAEAFHKQLFKGERKLIAAICDHNRNIVEPTPAHRTFRNPRKGSKLHGLRTNQMRRQCAAFERFLTAHPISDLGQGKTVGARANQFWAENRKALERAAVAKGEKRGYANAKALASAYRTSRA